MREKMKDVFLGCWYVVLTYWGLLLVRVGIQKAETFSFDEDDF